MSQTNKLENGAKPVDYKEYKSQKWYWEVKWIIFVNITIFTLFQLWVYFEKSENSFELSFTVFIGVTIGMILRKLLWDTDFFIIPFYSFYSYEEWKKIRDRKKISN